MRNALALTLALPLAITAALPAACDGQASGPTGPPPGETIGALCLEAIPVELAFESDHPNDRREGSVFVRACDGGAWHADVSVAGEGFIARQRVLSEEGDLRAFVGRSADIAETDHLALDVMYLARTIDDGAEATLVVRGRDDAGRVGRVELAVTGTVASTCAECGCCDDTVPTEAPAWSIHEGTYDPYIRSEQGKRCHENCPNGYP